jgi:4-amino-4-deoxy-L-arabinose transferase-like glycosyltransferase
MRINKKIIFVGIIILAAFLRLWKLDSIPLHLTPDEASLGYNAYSILQTGKDEYGQMLPLIFRSFGDYKPGLYVYLATPFIALFDLTEFSVRLPSAIAGIVSIMAIYLICLELWRDSKKINPSTMALCASFLMAINPWSIYFSRGAWEVNVALMLTLFGILFFLKALRRPVLFVFSAFFFALTLLTYQGAKMASVIVLVALITTYGEKVFKRVNFGPLMSGLFIGLVMIAPVLFSVRDGQASRLEVFSVFSYPRPENYLMDFLNQNGEKKNSLSYYAFHSESINFLRGILGRYFNHFSGRFLFLEGDWQNPRHSPPNQGVFLFSDILLLIFGIYLLTNRQNRAKWFIAIWCFLAPLPAILSRDQVHAVRAFNLSVPMIFILGVGLYFVWEHKKLLACYGAILVVSLLYFFDSYFIHLSSHNSKYWYFGYKEAVSEINTLEMMYDKIVFRQSFDQPYIFFLFYNKVDPKVYQEASQLTESDNKSDVGTIKELGKVQFTPIDWSALIHQKNTLVVTDAVLPAPELENIQLLKTIYYKDNIHIAFLIYSIK